MDSMKRLLFWLLEGTRGGGTRIRLLRILRDKPSNMRRLSIASELDYKTTEHHVGIMLKNSLLECTGGRYGRVYFVSEQAMAEKDFLRMIDGDDDGKKKR